MRGWPAYRAAGARGIVALAAAGVATVWGGALAARAATNGVTAQSPTAILAAATSAIDGVSEVHVAGSGVSGRTSISLDLHLVASEGGEGTVALDGSSFQFVVIGNEGYFKASPGFWKRYTNATIAQLVKNRWFKVPTTGAFASFTEFSNIHKLFSGLLGSHGTLAKGQLTTLRAQRVIPLIDKTQGGTLYVAATGKPYPVEIANPGQHGVIVIDKIDQPVRLTAPSDALNLSQLEKG
jgi:hypothetical protein